MKAKQAEFQKFEAIMRALLRSSHADIMAKLDVEKAAKRRKKARQSSASRVASDRA